MALDNDARVNDNIAVVWSSQTTTICRTEAVLKLRDARASDDNQYSGTDMTESLLLSYDVGDD